MKILITGCQGQVGASLVNKLMNDSNIALLALSRAELDITDLYAVRKVVCEYKPHFIINAAAYTAVDQAQTDIDNCYAINRDGADNLAQAAEQVKATILHLSTDYVFSGSKRESYLEHDPTDPKSIYGQSKLAGELAVAKKCSRHIILRTAWVFSEYGNNFVKTMLKLAASHTSLNIVEDQHGGPTYAGDIAQALITIAKSLYQNTSPRYGIYHFSGFPHTSWYEFSKEIFNQAQIQGLIIDKPNVQAIPSTDYPTAAERPRNSSLNCLLIHDSFGINQSDWKQALKHLNQY